MTTRVYIVTSEESGFEAAFTNLQEDMRGKMCQAHSHMFD